jgi:hypothetical protein
MEKSPDSIRQAARRSEAAHVAEATFLITLDTARHNLNDAVAALGCLSDTEPTSEGGNTVRLKCRIDMQPTIENSFPDATIRRLNGVHSRKEPVNDIPYNELGVGD